MQPTTRDGGEAAVLRDAATHNLRSYFAHVARYADGGRTHDVEGLLVFAGGHNYPGPFTNGMIRTNPRLSARSCLDRAQEFFQPLRRGYAVWARTDCDQDLIDACRDRGLTERPPPEGNAIIARRQPVEERPLSAGCELTEVVDEADRRAYLEVILAGNGLAGIDPALGERMLFSLDSTRGPQSHVVLARYDGEPAAGAMSFTTPDGAGGAHWAATTERARGRGLGRAVFCRAVTLGFADGAHCMTGGPSAMGLPLWLDTGFVEVGRYARWVARPPGA